MNMLNEPGLMISETTRPSSLLTDNLPLLAGAPNSIKKLRKLILELAVRGKLVPQDPSDEPTSELLKEAEKKRARLIAEEKIKRQKPLTEVTEEEKPFTIPSSWGWIRLGASLEMINGRAFKPSDWKASGLPIVRIQNLNREDAPFNYCDESSVEQRHIIESGTLLISWSGTPGTSFGAFIWMRGRAALNQHIFSCFQRGNIFFDRFLKLAINTRLDELIANAHGGVGLQHVTKGKLEALALVVPPLAEQHRIVAKVDELMALCDLLEAQEADAESAHARLVQALLDSLTQASDADDFATSWQRLAEHFHMLFTTESSIDALKQTLMQLAVMGKLVSQDPSDVMSDINAAPTLFRTKKKASLSNIDTLPFPIPSSWVWTSLGSLIVSGPTNGFSPKPSQIETGFRCLTLSSTTKGYFNGSCFKYVDITTDISKKYSIKKGDFLVQRANSIEYVGVSAIYDGEDDQYIYPDLMIRFRISEELNPSFIHLALSSVSVRSYFKNNATGTQGNMPKINQGTLVNALIPIPPLSEQHRIVTKFDQLMMLCDNLKDNLSQARRTLETLTNALVEQAVT